MKTVKIKQDRTGLTALRNELGFSQELLALYLKVNLSTLKMAEVGHRPLPTDTLIKVAELEIRLAATPSQAIYEDAHPAEKTCPEIFKDHYMQLTVKQNKCADECLLHESKITSMACNYLKARKRLQTIEFLLQNNKPEEFDAAAWQKQKETAIGILNKCGLPTQALLKSRIVMLHTVIELCKKLKLQIREALPEFFTEGNDLI